MRLRLSLACLFLGLEILFCPSSLVRAQEPLQEAPDQLVRMEDGFSLELAGGFQLGRQQDGYYLLGSRTIPGLILVKALPGLTAAELNKSLRTGYSDPTVQLTPRGPVTELRMEHGFGRLAEVEGVLMEGEVQGLLAGYLRESGGGLLLFAVTAPEQWPELNPVAEKMAESVRVFVPDPQELIRLWTERLAGFRLVRGTDASESGAGKQQENPEDAKVYHLCSSGAFLYEPNEDSATQENKPADSEDRVAGNWQVVPTGLRVDLVLTFEDGRSHSYRLSRLDQETYLDDQRYFVLPNERCR